MNTLIKSTGVPSMRSWMEDFWKSENLFDRSFFRNDNLPAVNIKENDGNFEIEVAAPGYKKKDFKIEVSSGVLTISADTHSETSEQSDNYTRKEFSSSSFCRSFGLPQNVNEDDVKAKYEDGLLQLSIKKNVKPEQQKKSISVE